MFSLFPYVYVKILNNNHQELLEKMKDFSTEKQKVEGVSFVSEMLTKYLIFFCQNMSSYAMSHMLCPHMHSSLYVMISQFLCFSLLLCRNKEEIVRLS